MVCDNKGALQRCPANREWMKTTATKFDLVSILSEMWESSNSTVKTQHVYRYGHQDSKYCGPLPLLGTLNVRMEILAKEATTTLQVPPPSPFSARSISHLPCKGYGRVSGQKGLYNKILSKKAVSYLAKKWMPDEEHFSTDVY